MEELFTERAQAVLEIAQEEAKRLIAKVRISDKKQLLEQINQLFDDTISEKNAFAIIQKLYEDKIITKKEGNLM